MDPITSSEVAGFAVGALLLAAAFAAPKADVFVARSQRRALKVCEECGGAAKLPCKVCKGRGQVKPPFAFFQKDGPSQPPFCTSCRGTGQLNCPTCVDGPTTTSS